MKTGAYYLPVVFNELSVHAAWQTEYPEWDVDQSLTGEGSKRKQQKGRDILLLPGINSGRRSNCLTGILYLSSSSNFSFIKSMLKRSSNRFSCAAELIFLR